MSTYTPVLGSTYDDDKLIALKTLDVLGAVESWLKRSESQQPYSYVSTASENATVVKASAGTIFNMAYTNTSNNHIYIKFYNKATTPNPSLDVPVFIWAGSKLDHDSIAFGLNPVSFPIGISFAIVSTATDGGAIGAGDVILNFSYA